MEIRSRILVVDDEESIRFTFENFLSEEGYDVTTAINYNNALAVLDQKEFDLIIIDIILGGKTGLDLVQEIRARDLRCQVVIITASPTAETVSDAYKKDVFEYISKPVRKDELLRVTREALSF